MNDAVLARHDLACRLAREAGALALSFFADRSSLTIETKNSPQDVVSHADRAVEDLIRARITGIFPEDAILGEEGGANRGDTGFGWVIDPIDGTMPFLSGLPHWCVAIAVTHAERPVAAATFAPVSGTLWEALAGGGARRDAAPLSVPGHAGLSGRMTALGASDRTDPAHLAEVVIRLLAAGGMFYRNGSGAMMLAMVADGSLAGYYEPHMHPWDALGGLLIAAEAGCRVLPYSAEHGRVLAASPGAYEQFLRVTGQGADAGAFERPPDLMESSGRSKPWTDR